MDDDYLRTRFSLGFLVPLQHDTDQLDRAIAEIKRDVTDSAERHLPTHCHIELQDIV